MYYQLLWGQYVWDVVLALIGLSASGRRDWVPGISRGACMLARTHCIIKGTKKKDSEDYMFIMV